jgi:Integrase zinc binding domain
LFADGYAADPFPDHVISLFRQGATRPNSISLSQCFIGPGDRLNRDGLLYVPNYDPLRLELIRRHHDAPSAGHPGRENTLELLCRRYYSSNAENGGPISPKLSYMSKDSYPRHAPFRLLKPLQIPKRPWKCTSIDFVTGLPPVGNHDAVWVVTDRLTKLRHFVACSSTTSAEDLAELFLLHLWKIHGLPDEIVSYLGP